MTLDPAEFAELIQPEADVLARTLAVAWGDADAAQDAVREAVLRVWAKVANGDDVHNPGGLLHTIALNQLRDDARRAPRAERAVRRAAQEAAGPVEGPENEALLRVQAEIVRDALAAIAPRQRLVLALHYLADLDVATIAEQLGITDGAVKNALFNGRRNLADKLRPKLQSEEINNDVTT